MASDLFVYWEDHRAPAFRRGVLGEFFASLILLFVTVGCVVFTQDGGISVEHQVQLSMMCGITVAVLVFIFAGISGAHFNSAFSWAAFLNAGMLCGTLFVKAMTPNLFWKVRGAANLVQPGMTATQGLAIEFGCTFAVFLTAFACMDEVRAQQFPHIKVLAPLVIGQAVTAVLFVGIPVDTCSINPSRTIAVAIASGEWDDVWVFIFGPYLGATACALVYRFIFALPSEVRVGQTNVGGPNHMSTG